MLERILKSSIDRRGLVMIFVVALAALGAWNFTRLPIDAVPDITNVQVQINTVVQALSPLEIEKQITFPIETAMAGLPHVVNVRSLSRYGLSQVTVIFADGTNIYFARQLVNERLQEARESLPPGLGEPALGPIATGLGEIYFWAVEADSSARMADGSPFTPSDLRALQDWVIKPQLRTVPGVIEVNSFGGRERQYEVLVLLARGYPIKTVSRMLNISVATVKSHACTLYQRLKVRNKGEAVYAALQRGATLEWVSGDEPFTRDSSRTVVGSPRAEAAFGSTSQTL